MEKSYYNQLLLDFLEAMKPQLSENDFNQESGLLQFDAADLVVYLLPHTFSEEMIPQPDFLRIEVALFQFDLTNQEDLAMNYQRFLLLHHLNTMSRLTSGMVSYINEEGVLFLGKIIPLENFSLDQLISETGHMIESAQELLKIWESIDKTEKVQPQHQKNPDDLTDRSPIRVAPFQTTQENIQPSSPINLA